MADALAPLVAPYTVVARRYRPQQFADLIGQEHVAGALTNAIRAGRIAHAYLFTGGRGMGKTTTARILAKALNCAHGPTPTPCDQCDQCTAIMAGDDVDVVEIDAATNTQVDNVRDLKANVGFRPQHGRFKVYIIDEVHMLSTASFNALLKTLEEPPAHVKFILATTEVQKLPATILSRCQRFDFAAITPAKVFDTLKHITAREGVKASDDALKLLARRANGSMRDAQTLLDQTLSAVTGELTADALHRLLGTAPDDRVAAIAEAVVGKDAKQTLALLGTAAADGVQPLDLLDQLTDCWRGLMLELVAGPGAPDLPGTAVLQECVRALAPRTDLDTVLAGVDVLTAARSKASLRGAHTQVLLEVAAVRLARLDDLVSVAALVQALGAADNKPVAVAAAGSGAKSVPAAPAPGATVVPRTVAPPEGVKKNAIVPTVEPTAAANTNGVGDISPGNVGSVWAEVLETLGALRKEQLKVAGTPAIIGPNTLAVRFPADYSSAYTMCSTEATLEILRNVLRKTTGRDCLVRVELLPPPPAARNGNGKHPAPADAPAPRPPGGNGPVERTKDILRLPLFVKAAEALGAQLLRVDDGFNPYAAAALADDAAEATDV